MIIGSLTARRWSAVAATDNDLRQPQSNNSRSIDTWMGIYEFKSGFCLQIIGWIKNLQ